MLNVSKSALSSLIQVQKIGAQAIIGAFGTILLFIAELEAVIIFLEY